MTPYATLSDLADWTGETAPANGDILLRTATTLVARAAGRNPYIDAPAPADVEPLRDATTAQAAAWIAAGVTPAALGIDSAPVKGEKLGSADITYDTAGQAEARATAATQLAPEAADILYNAGLLVLPLPVTADSTDGLADYGLSATFLVTRASTWWRNL